MSIDSKISIGNIVSWVLIAMTLAAGYAKLEVSTAQNSRDVSAARELVNNVDHAQQAAAASNREKINALAIDVAVVKESTKNIEKKLDVLIKASNGNQ